MVGSWLGEDSSKPSPQALEFFTDFPRTFNITDICSFFGFVEKVGWTFYKTLVELPFREVVSPKSEFLWAEDLQHAFKEAKKLKVQAVINGVS